MLDQQIPRRRPVDPAAQMAYAHSRSRTTSSGVFPMQVPQPQPMQLSQPPQPYGHNRRSPSVNTFSTVSSGGGNSGGVPGNPPPAAYRLSPTNDLRRSISSRSNGSTQVASYVALLRKQKATVWCDRAQYEDPRLLEKQRLAKMRANREVVGSGTLTSITGSGRTSTGLSSAGNKVAAKIRHHGKPAVVGYAPDSNYVGVGGVPLRLSATEVEGEDSDEDDLATQKLHHRRTGSSGRSSTAGSIGRRGLTYRSSAGSGLQMTGGGSQTGSRRWSPSDTPERTASMVEEKGGDAASGRAQSTGSGSSAERADDVPDMSSGAARLASNSMMNAAITREKSVKNPDELRRRGSVDERTMTLTSGRLFIANPD